MSYIICIASGKGGVGKTLVTAALSIALHRHQHSVLAVDADMGLRNLDLMFGVQDSVLYDANDIMKGKCHRQDALISMADGLDFLAASQKRTWEKVDAPTFHYTVENLSKNYDYIIIDCPPGRGQAYKAAVAIADRIFVVVEPTWMSLRDAGRIMQFCDKHKRFNYDILCNNFFRQDPAYVTVDEMLSVLDPESIAGILPHDMAIQQVAKEGTMVDVDQQIPFFQALEQTVRYIEDGAVPNIASLTALLPLCEGNSAVVPETPTMAEVPPLLKNRAIAELQQAAAILHDQPEITVSNEESGLNEVQEKRLSVRQRRQQSMAWRHYHR